MKKLPRLYYEEFFLRRRSIVEKMLSVKSLDELETVIAINAPLLAPIVATCGPAGPNAAPFMVSFLVREGYLGEALKEMRRIEKEYYGKRGAAYQAAAEFLLNYVYSPERADPLVLVSHIMSKGHTYTNIAATGRATIAILIPPDRGALELRARAEIVEEGAIYEYANRLHDLMHVVPHGERAHPWYPALVFRVEEIYDNSYQALGKKIYPVENTGSENP